MVKADQVQALAQGTELYRSPLLLSKKTVKQP
jgi:hypothetical protein